LNPHKKAATLENLLARKTRSPGIAENKKYRTEILQQY